MGHILIISKIIFAIVVIQMETDGKLKNVGGSGKYFILKVGGGRNKFEHL